MSDFMFFFSSRRRHTRFDCDWSSDVCSSDLRRRHHIRRRIIRSHRERDRRGGVQHLPHRLSGDRSEEHTSELQSQSNLVCRLLLEKKKKKITTQKQNKYSLITKMCK